MLPRLYQKILEPNLSRTEYLTLQRLIWVVQGCRNVALSKLAQRFPQPRKAASRLRSLQRFLSREFLSTKKLWFPW
ncbi:MULTISPECIES: hypothetical protein [unclassified Roseofilum]|uniref:hypothetical protein n=1 Tax=unclassified Roseofilum TaxID=2620099 RepID=UPI000E89FD48|nr:MULTISPECIES: hypothetical protein [unclassified Roseofilum]MBP0008375.1 hypothetical protein [Roseofilum sp. Belize Diploria]MBP0035429.1 hypothetical protein [Roseofilum sp. Belize BBD 4]HBQ97622.1 hypothetical protein [Cyanobacteria bacterium UBA11691]